MDKVIEYFELNVDWNFEDVNVYDSLGEVLMMKGENKKVIKIFKKVFMFNFVDNVK